MKFKGKVAWWFWAIVVGGNVLAVYELIFSRDNIAALLLGIVTLDVVFLPIVLRNYVMVEENLVTICFGLGKDYIKISDIVEVYQTHNPIASSAASLDRIVIKGRRSEMMCSVREKERLFEELKKRNPEIIFR